MVRIIILQVIRVTTLHEQVYKELTLSKYCTVNRPTSKITPPFSTKLLQRVLFSRKYTLLIYTTVHAVMLSKKH